MQHNKVITQQLIQSRQINSGNALPPLSRLNFSDFKAIFFFFPFSFPHQAARLPPRRDAA